MRSSYAYNTVLGTVTVSDRDPDPFQDLTKISGYESGRNYWNLDPYRFESTKLDPCGYFLLFMYKTVVSC
jgi:hypothetical protein